MKPSFIVPALALALSFAAQPASALPLRDMGHADLTHIEDQQPQSNSIQVVDQQGNPVAGASVMIGFAPGNPFSGNVITTDNNGSITAPSEWTSALPVTVESGQHVRMTYADVTPSDLEIRLHEKDGQDHIEIGGTTRDYGRIRKDGKVDFSLVIPAMTREGLLHFDVSSVVSPEVDTIRIITKQVDLPSNLALPRQRETYIFPITLDKPSYRVYVRRPGLYRLIATHGQFPLQRVVDDIRDGKSLFSVVNHFNFIGGGITDVEASKSGGRKDISVNSLSYDDTMQVKGPEIPAGHEMISMALASNDGYLFPTDVKRVQTGENITLKTVSSKEQKYLLSVMLNSETLLTQKAPEPSAADSDNISIHSYVNRLAEAGGEGSLARLSFVLQKAEKAGTPAFLPLIDAPVVDGNNLTFKAPAAVDGVTPAATYVILSEVESIERGQVKSEKRTRVWEVMTSSWVNSVELPDIELERKPDRTYRWEVMYLGRRAADASAQPQTGTLNLDDITHVTRNAVDF